jgi:hypothetical protein
MHVQTANLPYRKLINKGSGFQFINKRNYDDSMTDFEFEKVLKMSIFSLKNLYKWCVFKTAVRLIFRTFAVLKNSLLTSNIFPKYE